MAKEPKATEESKDVQGIGLTDTGQVNVIPPDQLEARLKEIREMRKAEGFDIGEDGDNDAGEA